MKVSNEVTALIPAAGSGRRMNGKINKIRLSLLGKSILEWTLEVFLTSELINSVILVVNPLEKNDLQSQFNEIIKRYQKEVVWVTGGAARQDSVINGLEYLKNSGWNARKRLVSIHDAARPLLTSDLLTAAIKAGMEFGAAGVGVPVKDTIKQVDVDGLIKATVDRTNLWAIQTPQVFDFDLIFECYQRVKNSGISFTDDCGVVEYCGYPVRMIMGSYENLKITTPEDLILAETILRRRTSANRSGV